MRHPGPQLKIRDTIDIELFHTLTYTESEDRWRTQLYDKRDDFNFPFICSNIPAVLAYGVCFLSGDIPHIVVLLMTPFIQVQFLMEQELLTLLEHLGSIPNFSCVRITQSVVFCRPFVVFLCFFVPLYCQFTTSNFPLFDIFKLFTTLILLCLDRCVFNWIIICLMNCMSKYKKIQIILSTNLACEYNIPDLASSFVVKMEILNRSTNSI